MSPEHAWGEAIDARADVFAAGIILWEMLAGRRLYKAGEGERLLDLARIAEIPELPSWDLPREGELHAIVARALHVDRGGALPQRGRDAPRPRGVRGGGADDGEPAPLRRVADGEASGTRSSATAARASG